MLSGTNMPNVIRWNRVLYRNYNVYTHVKFAILYINECVLCMKKRVLYMLIWVPQSTMQPSWRTVDFFIFYSIFSKIESRTNAMKMEFEWWHLHAVQFEKREQMQTKWVMKISRDRERSERVKTECRRKWKTNCAPTGVDWIVLKWF